MTRRILIRVDATPAIGAGHMMRMIAIGQLLQDHRFSVDFATVSVDRDTLQALETNRFTIHRLPDETPIGSAEDTAALDSVISDIAPDWVILDGYAFGTDYQRVIRSTGVKLMSVDDLANCHFVSDVVLNQNYGAESANYSTEPYTRKLLGSRYSMLRREFRTTDPGLGDKREPPNRFLVSLGGGTVAGMEALETIAAGLSLIDRKEIACRLIVGMFATPPESLVRLCNANPERFQLIRHVNQMSNEMSWSDVAISSGGSTVWELMRMRVPFLAVALNPPQVDFLEMLSRDGLCVTLGSHQTLETNRVRTAVEAFIDDQPRRQALVRAAEGLVDPERSGRAIMEIFRSQDSNSAT